MELSKIMKEMNELQERFIDQSGVDVFSQGALATPTQQGSQAQVNTEAKPDDKIIEKPLPPIDEKPKKDEPKKEEPKKEEPKKDEIAKEVDDTVKMLSDVVSASIKGIETVMSLIQKNDLDAEDLTKVKSYANQFKEAATFFKDLKKGKKEEPKEKVEKPEDKAEKKPEKEEPKKEEPKKEEPKKEEPKKPEIKKELPKEIK